MPKSPSTPDVSGRILATGDIVSYVSPGSTRLKLGVVVKPTAKGATIKPFQPTSDRPNAQQFNRSTNQISIVSTEYRDMQTGLVAELFKSNGAS